MSRYHQNCINSALVSVSIRVNHRYIMTSSESKIVVDHSCSEEEAKCIAAVVQRVMTHAFDEEILYRSILRFHMILWPSLLLFVISSAFIINNCENWNNFLLLEGGIVAMSSFV